MSEPGEAGDYYRAVEEEFLRRRGAPLLLSPRDWALIGDWQAAGIPLRIVLQGIANVFDAFERRPGDKDGRVRRHAKSEDRRRSPGLSLGAGRARLGTGRQWAHLLRSVG